MIANDESTEELPLEPGSGPTPAERARLARRLQAEAVQKANIMAANLGLVNGRMFEITHLLTDAALTAGIDAGPARCEMVLKFVRQIERTCKVVHELESLDNAGRERHW
jgi:hypothetical protein